MDQHANAFSETLPPTVVQDIVPNMMTGIVTEDREGPGTRPGIRINTNSVPAQSAGRQSSPVKIKDPKRLVLSGKALKDWIIDKGFDGVSTQLQRDRPREREKESVTKESKDPIRSSYEVRKK